MPYKDPTKRREYLNKYKRDHRVRNPRVPLSTSEKRKRLTERLRDWRRRHPGASTAISTRWRHNLRRTVISMYGGECACCGELEFAFLVIDHVGGGGSKHIRSFSSYSSYLSWLKARKRDGFRVLCHNCNMARARFGSCPHGNGI